MSVTEQARYPGKRPERVRNPSPPHALAAALPTAAAPGGLPASRARPQPREGLSGEAPAALPRLAPSLSYQRPRYPARGRETAEPSGLPALRAAQGTARPLAPHTAAAAPAGGGAGGRRGRAGRCRRGRPGRSSARSRRSAERPPHAAPPPRGPPPPSRSAPPRRRQMTERGRFALCACAGGASAERGDRERPLDRPPPSRSRSRSRSPPSFPRCGAQPRTAGRPSRGPCPHDPGPTRPWRPGREVRSGSARPRGRRPRFPQGGRSRRSGEGVM